MTTITQVIGTLPDAPARSDPINFDTRADDFLNEMETLPTELNAFATQANTVAGEVNTNATLAETAKAIAVSAANAEDWVSGTTYALHDTVISLADHKSYRRIVAGAGTTDPSLDGTNWQAVVFVQLEDDTSPTLGGDLALGGHVITGMEIGTDVQAYDAGLNYLDGLNFTDEATFKSTTNLEIGVDVQAHDPVLDDTTASYTTAEETKLAGIATSANNYAISKSDVEGVLTGAITSHSHASSAPAYGAIGSIVIAYESLSSYYSANTTTAGSNLLYASSNFTKGALNGDTDNGLQAYDNTSTFSSLSLTGTWLRLTNVRFNNGGYYAGLYQRTV